MIRSFAKKSPPIPEVPSSLIARTGVPVQSPAGSPQIPKPVAGKILRAEKINGKVKLIWGDDIKELPEYPEVLDDKTYRLELINGELCWVEIIIGGSKE